MGPHYPSRYEEFHHLDKFPGGVPPEEKGPEGLPGWGPFVRCPRCKGTGSSPYNPPNEPNRNPQDLRDAGYVQQCEICGGHGRTPFSKWWEQWWAWLRSLFGR